jgi:hypothetical protein
MQADHGPGILLCESAGGQERSRFVSEVSEARGFPIGGLTQGQSASAERSRRGREVLRPRCDSVSLLNSGRDESL